VASEGRSFPPLRSDAPGRVARVRGSMPDLTTASSRKAATESLEEGIYANSSRDSQRSLWKFIVTVLDKWDLDPFPPTVNKITSLGAALEAGSYASAENYLSQYRIRCQRADSPFTASMDRALLDAVRSCKRGAGAPVRALGLPLLQLGGLGLSEDIPWVQGGPVGSACAMVAGAWFMTREVELSTSRASLVSLETNAALDLVFRWSLPASKTDTEACGVARAHGCNCDGKEAASCPYHAISGQLARLKKLFPRRWSDEGPDDDLPLFPALDGSAVTKERMTATIVEAARRLSVPLASPDGSSRVSGHSLRVSGAQGLSRAGIDVWAIQLLGRWGSDAVLGYSARSPLRRPPPGPRGQPVLRAGL
jgi:hypothetical protein